MINSVWLIYFESLDQYFSILEAYDIVYLQTLPLSWILVLPYTDDSLLSNGRRTRRKTAPSG